MVTRETLLTSAAAVYTGHTTLDVLTDRAKDFIDGVAIRVAPLAPSLEAATDLAVRVFEVCDAESISLPPGGAGVPLDVLSSHVAGIFEDEGMRSRVKARLAAKDYYYADLMGEGGDPYPALPFRSHKQIADYFAATFYRIPGKAAAERAAIEDLALAYEAALIMRVVPLSKVRDRDEWAEFEAGLPNAAWVEAVRSMVRAGTRESLEAARGACLFFARRVGQLSEKEIDEVVSFVESMQAPLRELSHGLRRGMRPGFMRRLTRVRPSDVARLLRDFMSNPGRRIVSATEAAWAWVRSQWAKTAKAATETAREAGTVVTGAFRRGAAAATVAAAVLATDPAAAAPAAEPAASAAGSASGNDQPEEPDTGRTAESTSTEAAERAGEPGEAVPLPTPARRPAVEGELTSLRAG